MNGLTKYATLGVLRAFLAATGGFLAASGLGDVNEEIGVINSNLEVIGGAAMTLTAAAMSVYNKFRVERKIDTAAEVAATTGSATAGKRAPIDA